MAFLIDFRSNAPGSPSTPTSLPEVDAYAVNRVLLTGPDGFRMALDKGLPISHAIATGPTASVTNGIRRPTT